MAKKLEVMGTLKQTPVQPDWNQNDPNAPDYVKNRTHWVEVETYTGNPIKSMTFTGDSTHINIDIFRWKQYQSQQYIKDEIYCEFDGKTYPGLLCGSGMNVSIIFDSISLTIRQAQPTDTEQTRPTDTEQPMTYMIGVGGAAPFGGSDITGAGDGDHVFALYTINHMCDFHRIHKSFLPPTIGERYLILGDPDKGTAEYGGEIFNVVGDGMMINNRAEGSYSHAEGNLTTAAGNCAHSEGYRTSANGWYSHAEGQGTISSGSGSHAEGRWNIEDSNYKYAHVVGNGTDDANRSNAHTLDWDGNAWYAGTIEGTALILKSSTPDSTKRFKITVDDSGTISASAID